MKKIILFLFCLLNCYFMTSESKHALLIANNEYTFFGRLATPVQEAEAFSAALESIGFEVTVVKNAGLEEMKNALYEFSEVLKSEGGTAVFHFGGHAVQVNGSNFLIPVDQNIETEQMVLVKALNVDEVMTSMRADTNIVILDACRNNPLATEARGIERGLKVCNIKPKNSVIIYSAEAGKTAQDGVFTPSLTSHITENKEIGYILREVRKDVLKKTNNMQNPGEYNQLIDEVYLAGNYTGTDSEENHETTAAEKTIAVETQKKNFVSRYEDENRMVLITGGTFTMGSDTFSEWSAPAHEVTVDSYYIGVKEINQKFFYEITGLKPENIWDNDYYGDEKPMTGLNWYKAIVFCNKLSIQDGLEPCYVINNSVNPDEWGFIPKQKLNIAWEKVICKFSADGYRLPTEAEWEYAARGYIGKISDYAWFSDYAAGKLVPHECGKKAPNSYGIYDMLGNVSEFCWDYWGSYKSENQKNPRGPYTAEVRSMRVVRGGSYMFPENNCSLYTRECAGEIVNSVFYGFRVVRKAE